MKLYQRFINKCEFVIMLLEFSVRKRATSPALEKSSFLFLNNLVL